MHNQRVRFYIDPSVQSKLILRLVSHWFAYFAGAFLVLMLFQAVRMGPTVDPFLTVIGRIFVQNLPLVIIFLVLMPVFVWDTIKWSNRFVGPMYRLRMAMRKVAETGELAPLSFREKDYWKLAAEDYNAMIERLTADTQRHPNVAAESPMPVSGRR